MNFVNSVLQLGRPKTDDYELLAREESFLPSPRGHANEPPIRSWRRRCRQCRQLFTLRRIWTILSLIPIFLVCGILWSGIPPSYSSCWQYERTLPQHNLSLPAPEGQNGSYVRFSNSLWGHGWNNVLQERILLSHLAFLSNRSYVFEPYTWSHSPLPFTLYDFALRPSRIPLNAIISGPGAGGSQLIPRAINLDWWETVCPPERRTVLNAATVSQGVENAEGSEILQRWVDTFDNVRDNCVEIAHDSRPVFDWELFGSPRILSIWPTLSMSPILRSFAWSPVVLSSLLANLPILTSSTQSHSIPDNFPGLLAVHIRRGDYVRHCTRLFRWSTIFLGYNTFPTLPQSSRLNPPPITSPDERLAYYTRRCWPSYEDIAHRIDAVRVEWERGQPGRKLDRIFVLTNGGRWWSHWLKERLTTDGWTRENIKVSSDLTLSRDGKYVDFAVDMAIAERAEAFIGNGFSSLTSNVVMLRMARNADPKSNHMW